LVQRLRAEARPAVEAQAWEKVIAHFEADLAAIAGCAPGQLDAGPPIPASHALV
jgi:hypothetical protein